MLGNLWLAVIGLLMAAFYGSYLLKKVVAKEKGGRFIGGLVALAVTGLVWAIAVVMISNYFITTDREHWSTLLGASWRIIHQMTFVPRTLHFLTGAFAVTGFWMVWLAWWRVAARRAGGRRQGLPPAGSVAGNRRATGIQISVGVWLLIWSPVDVWDFAVQRIVHQFGVDLRRGDGAGHVRLFDCRKCLSRRGLWTKVSTALLGWTLFGMVAGREAVRQLVVRRGFSRTRLAHTHAIRGRCCVSCARPWRVSLVMAGWSGGSGGCPRQTGTRQNRLDL